MRAAKDSKTRSLVSLIKSNKTKLKDFNRKIKIDHKNIQQQSLLQFATNLNVDFPNTKELTIYILSSGQSIHKNS